MKKLIVLVLLVFAGALWYWRHTSQSGGDEQDYSALKSQVVVHSLPSGWKEPTGQGRLNFLVDRSKSVSEADRAIEDKMVEEVVNAAEGNSFVSIWGFADTYETFGNANREATRAAMLARWRAAQQKRGDEMWTNIAKVAAAVLADGLPNAKAGDTVLNIIVSDGLQDSSPADAEFDQDYIADISEIMGQVPDLPECRARLRTVFIPVGKGISDPNAVARDILGGRGETLPAASWSEVEEIVLALQASLQGKYELQGLPVDAVEIDIPTLSAPKVLGEFDFSLTGPEEANFRFRVNAGAVATASKMLVAVRVNGGDWQSLPAEISLKNNDRLEFSLAENPADQFDWYDEVNQVYQIKLEAGKNNLSLTEKGNSRLAVKIFRASFYDRWISPAWKVLAFLAFFLFAWLIRRARKRNRRLAESVAPDKRFVVRFKGEETDLSQGETALEPLNFRRVGDDVFVTPAYLLEVAFDEPKTLTRQQDYISAGEEALLPARAEVELTDQDSGDIYTIIRKEEPVWQQT